MNGIMVWAWMLRSAHALGTRTELWFGHGCSGQRMLSGHEWNYGLGMDAPVLALIKDEWSYGLGMDALVSACSWDTNGIMVWAWMLGSAYALETGMLWSAYALGTRSELWFGHGCSGQRMLLGHEWKYGVGKDALVSLCSWDTNGIMVWAWMLWSAHALGTRTELWFGHGCSGQRMLLRQGFSGQRMLLGRERNYGLGMDALVKRMLLGHERKYGVGMDALVSLCSCDTNGSMVWEWMLWSAYALGTRTELWFGHGCPGQRMLFGARPGLMGRLKIDIKTPHALGLMGRIWLAEWLSGWIRGFEWLNG